MAELNSLHVLGSARGEQAPVAASDFVRLLELQNFFSGVAAISHTHPSTDITDFDAAVAAILADFDFPTTIPLKPNGGLLLTGEGYAVNSGIVSFVGHTHTANDIEDLGDELLAWIRASLVDTSSVRWHYSGVYFSGVVHATPHGGVKVTGDGVEVDFDEVARANHTHAQLHNPLTLGESGSLDLSLATQQLTAEVRLDGTGGLKLGDVITFTLAGSAGFNGEYRQASATLWNQTGGTNYLEDFPDSEGWVAFDADGDAHYLCLYANFPEGPWTRIDDGVNPVPTSVLTRNGVACDFGTGENQVARGNHTHAGLHDPVTVVATTSIHPYVTNQVWSGVVVCDPAPGSGKGKVAIGGGGLYIPLGTAVDMAAAGNHVHSAATPDVDGFLSKQDKARLDALVSAGFSGVVQVAGFTREAVFTVGKYLLGRFQWPMGVELLNAEIVCLAPQATTILTLEVDGVLSAQTITLPSGVVGTEITAGADLAHLAVPSESALRWKITSGPAASGAQASNGSLWLQVFPA